MYYSRTLFLLHASSNAEMLSHLYSRKNKNKTPLPENIKFVGSSVWNSIPSLLAYCREIFTNIKVRFQSGSLGQKTSNIYNFLVSDSSVRYKREILVANNTTRYNLYTDIWKVHIHYLVDNESKNNC